MKVTVVGTSCTWFKRKNTSFIIDDDIVLDVPEGAYKDIVNTINIFDIKGVLITHLHTDHCLNLHVITTRYIRENHGRKEPLKVYCPKGTLDKILEMNRLFYGGPDEADKEKYVGKVEFVDLEDGLTFELGKYVVTAYKVEHGRPETFGFVFKEKNGVAVGFSADTKDCENLHKILEDSNYAFVEMSTMTPHHAHLSADEFVALSKKYPNTKMYPVHTSDAAQEFCVKNGLNYLVDGQIVEF